MRAALYIRQCDASPAPVETRHQDLSEAVKSFGYDDQDLFLDQADRGGPQPAWRRLRRTLATGHYGLVALWQWHDPYPNLSRWVRDVPRILNAGMDVYVHQGRINTREPLLLAPLMSSVDLCRQFQAAADSETAHARALRREGAPWQITIPKVSDRQIEELLRKGLSFNGIRDYLAKRRIRVGKGTVSEAACRVFDSGRFSREQHTAAKARRRRKG